MEEPFGLVSENVIIPNLLLEIDLVFVKKYLLSKSGKVFICNGCHKDSCTNPLVQVA